MIRSTWFPIGPSPTISGTSIFGYQTWTLFMPSLCGEGRRSTMDFAISRTDAGSSALKTWMVMTLVLARSLSEQSLAPNSRSPVGAADRHVRWQTDPATTRMGLPARFFCRLLRLRCAHAHDIALQRLESG